VGLAGAGRAEQDDVVFGFEEVELAEVEHKRLLDRALEAEVELLKRLAGREARLPDPGLAAVSVTRRLLGLQHGLEEVLVRPFLAAGALGQLGERAGCGWRFHRPKQVGELGALAHAGISAS
jgi:hypothetical protein